MCIHINTRLILNIIQFSVWDSKPSSLLSYPQPTLNHRIGRHTVEVPLALEALKFVSSCISHYACCPPLLWPVNDIFWPINTLYWLAAPPSGQSTAYFCIKIRGHVAPLSGTSVYLPILWLNCMHVWRFLYVKACTSYYHTLYTRVLVMGNGRFFAHGNLK